MQFIAIAENLLINPDTIVSMEKKKKSVTLTTVDGKQYIVEKDFRELIPALRNAGVDSPEQFWAG